MKIKTTLMFVGLFLVVGIGFAQKKNEAKSIINDQVSIKKYFNKEELERLPKGDLLTLYTERTEALIETLPYIAFATKPGITMTSLGIPNDSDNRKILDAKFEATEDFIDAIEEFQGKILPYSDTSKLISAILFYEDILKSLHEYGQYN